MKIYLFTTLRLMERFKEITFYNKKQAMQKDEGKICPGEIKRSA